MEVNAAESPLYRLMLVPEYCHPKWYFIPNSTRSIRPVLPKKARTEIAQFTAITTAMQSKRN